VRTRLRSRSLHGSERNLFDRDTEECATRISKAVEYITSDRVRDTLSETVDIFSSAGHELELARYLKIRMQRAGLDTEFQCVDDNRPTGVNCGNMPCARKRS
jgi:hypothetical protein